MSYHITRISFIKGSHLCKEFLYSVWFTYKRSQDIRKNFLLPKKSELLVSKFLLSFPSKECEKPDPKLTSVRGSYIGFAFSDWVQNLECGQWLTESFIYG